MRLDLFLPAVLSVIAGSADVISFLGLDGLFNAHITGNLVIIAAHFVAGQMANMALLLSVPTFIVVLALTGLVAVWLSDFGANALVRFDPVKEAFEVFPLPSSDANVRQLLGRHGEVWGAESGVDRLVVLRLP